MNTFRTSAITVLHIMSQLNTFELEILNLLTHGKSPEEIASALKVELPVIEAEITCLLEKFEEANTQELADTLNEIRVLDALIQR